ncbi:hypothetical protein BC833DRAFT_440382 [Globomyces pollinis-pini]|nr:hypothetical protein BC833DRAFT_440382 [Globomyces pollinis-pini]
MLLSLILNIHHSNDIQIIQSNQDINSHKSNALNSQSAFLKLSEYWLLSTNSFRVILLLVFSNVSCLSHSIAQPYDILHRISNVLESNDPVARALTIRVLGYLADIADTPELHHRILTALVDPDIDDFELSASIFTAIQLSIQNADFALSICTLLVCLPQSQNLGQLSKLLPVFEHLDRKITFAPLAVEIFKKMFEVHQLDSEEQLTLYLAMTKYSLKTLVLISSQVENEFLILD